MHCWLSAVQPVCFTTRLQVRHCSHKSAAWLCECICVLHFADCLPCLSVSVSAGDLSWVSAYMPNVMYHDIGAGAVHPSDRIKGLAFVATRQIRDEEVLLNYRLNPQVQKPAWYAPVDVAEDKRRWY